MPKNNDAKTLELIEEVKRRKEEISKAERPNWITTCSFSFNEDGSGPAVNLHVADLKRLVSVTAFLLRQRESHEAAIEVLGVADPALLPFTWNGFTVEQWVEDIKSRIAKIQINSKKQSLEKLEARLNAVISPELKAQMELDAIERDLKK